VSADRAKKLKKELTAAIVQKLQSAAPGSEESHKALKLLEGLNNINPVTLLETIRHKQNLEVHIGEMEKVELQYHQKASRQAEMYENFKVARDTLEDANKAMHQALADVAAAREAFAKAQERLTMQKDRYSDLSAACATIEEEWNESSYELRKMEQELLKEEQKVQQAIKEQLVG